MHDSLTVNPPPPRDRLGGLRRFAVAITVLNLLGHTVLGFEQSWAQPVLSVATAYATELLLEVVDAAARRRKPRFIGRGVRGAVDFLLSAHISGLAVAMLLYANDRLAVIAFGAAFAIASKAIFRAGTGVQSRHFFNPSNVGITAVLVLFPWVGVAPPYQFTADLGPVGGWVLPGVIVCTGTYLNARFTKRLPLIAAWVGGYGLQAVVRWAVQDTPLWAGLAPMTGVAFVLFSFYMVTDPATTPEGRREQVLFGASVAALYSVLVSANAVFGMFFALSIVCALRGFVMTLRSTTAKSKDARALGWGERSRFSSVEHAGMGGTLRLLSGV